MFRLDSWRDGWHAWPQGHSWPGLQGEVDAAFAWDGRTYLIQVGHPPGTGLLRDITPGMGAAEEMLLLAPGQGEAVAWCPPRVRFSQPPASTSSHS